MLSTPTIYSTYTNICCKWYDNKAALLLASNIEAICTCSRVQPRMKGSSSKIPINCPSLVKMYNKGMGGVDLIESENCGIST